MYEFTISSELEMESTSCKVNIPYFDCYASKEVKKDKGYIAVEARTSVEVAEVKYIGLGILDVSEVPDKLFNMAGNPLLFAYKFINPNYSLTLDIKKHTGRLDAIKRMV
jgi:hypothetical protein